MSNKLTYNGVADLRTNYPDFFWEKVRPYIGDALRYLQSLKKANSGLPIYMRACSRLSIEANFRTRYYDIFICAVRLLTALF